MYNKTGIFCYSSEMNLWFSEHNFRVRGEASKVMLHIFEDKVKATRHSWCYKTFQFDNIGMIEASQNYDLPCHKTHTVSLQIIKSDLFESDDLPCVQISSLVYIAICPLPNLLEQTIACKYVWIVKTIVSNKFASLHRFVGKFASSTNTWGLSLHHYVFCIGVYITWINPRSSCLRDVIKTFQCSKVELNSINSSVHIFYGFWQSLQMLQKWFISPIYWVEFHIRRKIRWRIHAS